MDEEIKMKNREYMRVWYSKNRERAREIAKESYARNREKILEYAKEHQDERIKYNKWIVENIFSKPCAHCGETDWHKLGCNRLDNSKPHTMDNVEPCCHDCNLKLVGLGRKKVYQYTLDGELVKIWNSVTECASNGYNKGHVSDCCLGKQKKHKGYKWSFEPL